MITFLFQLLILMLVLGIFWYIIDGSPFDATLKWIFKAIILVIAAVFLLSMSGLFGGEPLRIPHG